MLALTLRPAPTAQAELFQLAAGAPLTYLGRLRTADGHPLCWDVRWLPQGVAERVTRAELETTSLFDILPRHGFELSEMVFEIRARPARTVEARRLSCRRGSTVLQREVVCTAPQGGAVITGFSIYPADRVGYRARLSLNGGRAEAP